MLSILSSEYFKIQDICDELNVLISEVSLIFTGRDFYFHYHLPADSEIDIAEIVGIASPITSEFYIKF